MVKIVDELANRVRMREESEAKALLDLQQQVTHAHWLIQESYLVFAHSQLFSHIFRARVGGNLALWLGLLR